VKVRHLIIGLLIGGATSAAGAGDPALVARAQDAIREALKDPQSAQFKDVYVRELKTSRVVCGSVNAKNSYGGYVGFRPFFVMEPRGSAPVDMTPDQRRSLEEALMRGGVDRKLAKEMASKPTKAPSTEVKIYTPEGEELDARLFLIEAKMYCKRG
jgi:hypothetical protein